MRLSILIGGVLALRQDVLKQVLAYSTISQYGYLVLMYGIGSAAGNGAAAFYVLAHGVAKSALFMAAGAVTVATGEDRLSRLGGLGRRMPLLAVVTGLAAASLAALPLTVGFFKDELFFTAALGAGPLTAALAVAAAALTFAYIARFWILLFLGRPQAEAAEVSWVLVAPVAVLAVVSVLGGLVAAPFAEPGHGRGHRVAWGCAHRHPGLPPGRATGEPAGAAPRGCSAGCCSSRGDRWDGLSRGLAAAGNGSVHGGSTRRGCTRWSASRPRCTTRRCATCATSVAAVLVPAGVLVALAFAVTPTAGAYTPARWPVSIGWC